IYTLREALKTLKIDIKETTASIQGFGNVAEYAARLYTSMGGKVISVSCWDNQEKRAITVRKLDGLDIEAMAKIKDSFGTIDKAKAKELGCELLDGDQWIEQEVDILLPCALENQLTPTTFAKVSDKVKVICEGANGPTTTDCDKLIKERNIYLIPDFLCNAGG